VFQSRDPWEGTGWRPATLNYYTYVQGNPVLHTDPSGHCIDGITTVPCVVIAGGVVVVIGSGIAVHHATQQLLNTPFVQKGIEDLANAVGGFFDNLGEDVAEAIEDCRVVLFRGGPGPQTQAATPSPRIEPYQSPLPFPDPHPLSEPKITPVPLPPLSPDNDSKDKLYHYGTQSKIDYIVTYQIIPFSHFSENPKRARFGSGIYFTDLAPGSREKARLARALYGNPFPSTQKSVEAWVYVDVSGLDVFPTGRPHILLHPRESNLPVSGRIVATGETPP